MVQENQPWGPTGKQQRFVGVLHGQTWWLGIGITVFPTGKVIGHYLGVFVRSRSGGDRLQKKPLKSLFSQTKMIQLAAPQTLLRCLSASKCTSLAILLLVQRLTYLHFLSSLVRYMPQSGRMENTKDSGYH